MEVIEFQTTIFLFVASLFFGIFIYCIFKAKRPAVNLPPGPVKLPFIGNLYNLIGGLPHLTLEGLAAKYGPVMHLQLGELSTVVISSADAAKQVMKTHDASISSRPSIKFSDTIMYGNRDIAFAPYGEYWRQLRKICMLELLSAKRVQSFRFIREEVFLGVVNWIASNDGLSVNLMEKLMLAMFDMVSRCAVGNVREERDALVYIFDEIVKLASGFDMTDLFPSSGLIQKFSTSAKRLKKYHDVMDNILEKIIKDHRVVDEKEKHECILDVLLRYQEEGHEFHLSSDTIKAVIVDILLGGSETSATSVIWALAEMMKNPIILQKAQEEVRHVFDSKGYVDESDMDQLKYLKCVIKETLRLHPPVPLLIPRKCIKECEINGYVILPETRVIVNAWAANRDPLYWKNPHCFTPERFLDSKVDYQGNHFEFIPFGAGRRMCPGMSFGTANIQLPLALLLCHFDWSLPAGMKVEDMDMTEEFSATARMKKPLIVVPMSKRPIRLTSPNDY